MRVSGMTTGLDVDSLVSQLMSVEKQPLESLKKKQSAVTSVQSAWEALDTKLSDFKDLTDDLKTASTYSERTVDVDDNTIAGIDASTEAANGSYQINILSLAQPQRIESGVFSSSTTAMNISGTVTIGTKSITIPATDTMENLAARITSAGAGVTARVVKLSSDRYRLAIISNSTGSSSGVTYTDSGTATYTIDSSAPAVASATITGDAAAGKVALSVSALASANSVDSDSQVAHDVALNLAGSFSVNSSAVNLLVTDTLDDVVTKINGAHAGVTASVIDNGGVYTLRLTASTTGAKSALNYVDGNGMLRALGVLTSDLTAKNTVIAAQDASYMINGVSCTSATNNITDVAGVSIALASTGTSDILTTATGGVFKSLGVFTEGGSLAHQTNAPQDARFSIDGTTFVRSTNSVTDAVPGFTITLKKPGETSIDITDSSENTVTKIKDWVSKYNDIVGSLKTQTDYDVKGKSGGTLYKDSMAKDLLTRLRSKSVYVVSGLSSYASLDKIGITIGKYGSVDADKLTIEDDTDLTDTVENYRTEVMKFFGAPTSDIPSPTDGMAVTLSSLLDSYVHNQTGQVDRHTESLETEIDDFQTQIDALDLRLQSKEQTLYKTYSAMEVKIARMKSQGQALLASLNTSA
jgi:flagellar hook-associated protein 2